MKIKGLIIEVCGSWLWISGDTKPVKDQIKAVETGESYKRGWHKTKGLWYFSPTSYRKYSKEEKSIDEIRALYGSTTIKSKGTLVLN